MRPFITVSKTNSYLWRVQSIIFVSLVYSFIFVFKQEAQLPLNLEKHVIISG